TCTWIACRGVAKTAVAAQITMEAIGIHGVEKHRRLTLRGNDRRPPLGADRGNVHEVEQLEGHVGLQQRIRLAIVEYATAQVGKPLLLERRCRHCRLELAVSHGASPAVARPRTPC